MTDPTTARQILGENTVSLAQAARRQPPGRNGAPCSLQTILRWILDGVPGPDGHRVRLGACRLGGRWLTSIEALARFATELTPTIGDRPVSRQRTLRQWRRAAERAEQELEKLGIAAWSEQRTTRASRQVGPAMRRHSPCWQPRGHLVEPEGDGGRSRGAGGAKYCVPARRQPSGV
jgi:hypothetical protein